MTVGPTASGTPAGKRHALNERLIGFGCIRCSTALPVDDYFEGCPACFAAAHPASVRPAFAGSPPATVDAARGMGRYAEWLPYSSWITLGEGATPCVAFPRLASEIGCAAIFIKNEGQNPSGSHKDRVSCLTVTRALDVGAPGIVAASSGNGGASVALYAAHAGIACRVVATPALSPIHRRAITQSGAELIFADEALERWRLVTAMVHEEGWFPATNYLEPPVGSNHFGVEGLKTIAFELIADVGRDIGAVLVPTSRGDLIWGVYEGFRQLREAGQIGKIPKLFVVEPFPRVARVLDGSATTGSYPGRTGLFSIGGSTVTYQAVEAVRASGGGAVVVDDGDVTRDAERLARHGCYAELSSAATLTGLDRLLVAGAITREETVVLLATSNGYKDVLVETVTR